MRDAVAEIYDAYVDELRRYKAWTDGRKQVYGEDSSPMMGWGDSDWTRVNAWNAELKAIERVLGLTVAEVEAASVSVGIETEITRAEKKLAKAKEELEATNARV